MKSTLSRCAAMALAVALFLSACGRAAPEPTEPTTIETEITTEAPTTTSFTPMSGASNGVAWRTLNLEDEKNAEIKAWLQTQFNPIPKGRPGNEWEPEQTEFTIGENKIIVRFDGHVGEQPDRHIYLRTPDGKETLLLKGDDPDQEDPGSPRIVEILDDRYFLFEWRGYQWSKGTSVYDIQNMREISVGFNDNGHCITGRYDNHLYFVGCDSDVEYYGPVALYLSDLSALPKQITPINLLAGLPHTSAGLHYGGWLSPDERYYIVNIQDESREDDLRVFDIKSRKFIAHFSAPQDTFRGYYAFRDNKTLYLYGTDWESRPVNDETNYALTPYAIEITLS